MLTGCVVIYFQLGAGRVRGCRAAGIAAGRGIDLSGCAALGPAPALRPQQVWGFLGSSFIPNHGSIWLNRVTAIPSAVSSHAVSVPSTQSVWCGS